MAKRTYEKRLRAFDIVKGVTGKLDIVPRTTLRPPQARQPYVVNCGNGQKITVMVSPGQVINTRKICKRKRS